VLDLPPAQLSDELLNRAISVLSARRSKEMRWEEALLDDIQIYTSLLGTPQIP
jgi:hypothetical protein